MPSETELYCYFQMPLREHLEELGLPGEKPLWRTRGALVLGFYKADSGQQFSAFSSLNAVGDGGLL
jgi:hypothetical protein